MKSGFNPGFLPFWVFTMANRPLSAVVAALGPRQTTASAGQSALRTPQLTLGLINSLKSTVIAQYRGYRLTRHGKPLVGWMVVQFVSYLLISVICRTVRCPFCISMLPPSSIRHEVDWPQTLISCLKSTRLGTQSNGAGLPS